VTALPSGILKDIPQAVERVVVGAIYGPKTGPRHLKIPPKHYKNQALTPTNRVRKNATKGFSIPVVFL
jgi:hypothetical protein